MAQEQQNQPKTLEAQLDELRARLEALENKPANSVSADALKAAMDDHPDFKRITDFLAKWGHK
jgi:hypothetical protein